MPALLNKKNFISCSVLLFFSCEPVRATQLHLNAGTSLNITNATYIDILTDAPVESPVDTNETVVYLNTGALARVNLHSEGVIELFWNGFPVGLSDFDSRWLFVNGLCDDARQPLIFPKPENWNLVLPDHQCEGHGHSDDLVLTSLVIKHRHPADSQPQKRAYPFPPGGLDAYLIPSSAGRGRMIFDGAAGITAEPSPVFFKSSMHPLEAEQRAFFQTPASYTQNEITVFILNFPISQQNLKRAPNGAEMNRIVEDAITEEALLRLIIRAMINLGYIREKINLEEELKRFLQKVKTSDGKVNVQLVINYIKETFRNHNSHIAEKSPPQAAGKGPTEAEKREAAAAAKRETLEAVRQIITVMAGLPADSGETELNGETSQPSVATKGLVSAYAAFTHRMALIQQLIETHGNSANKIISFLFSLFPELGKKGYGNSKRQITNEDGSINARQVLALLESVDDFEPALESELKTPTGEHKYRRKPQKRRSAQGLPDKETKF